MRSDYTIITIYVVLNGFGIIACLEAPTQLVKMLMSNAEGMEKVCKPVWNDTMHLIPQMIQIINRVRI